MAREQQIVLALDAGFRLIKINLARLEAK